jgi:hypothetical protein
LTKEDAKLSDVQRLAKYDEGGDVLRTVRHFIADQSNVALDVIEKRAHVAVSAPPSHLPSRPISSHLVPSRPI